MECEEIDDTTKIWTKKSKEIREIQCMYVHYTEKVYVSHF